MSEEKENEGKTFREFFTFEINKWEFFFRLYSNIYPKSLPEKEIMFPKDYEMIGLAAQRDKGGLITAIGFTIWKPWLKF
jgi:hypothetical protein